MLTWVHCYSGNSYTELAREVDADGELIRARLRRDDTGAIGWWDACSLESEGMRAETHDAAANAFAN